MQACNPRQLHYNEYYAISQIHILQIIDWFYLTRKKEKNLWIQMEIYP